MPKGITSICIDVGGKVTNARRRGRGGGGAGMELELGIAVAVVVVVVVVFSSLATIWGDCSTIHSLPTYPPPSPSRGD